MSVEAPRGKELLSQDRMAFEIIEAAKALGINIPVEEYTRTVLDIIKMLNQQTAHPYQTRNLRGQEVTLYSIPHAREQILSQVTTSIKQLGGVDKIQSGMVMWNIGSFSGHKPVPYELCLVKMNPGGPAQPGYIPISQCDIARISVITGNIDFAYPVKSTHPQSVSPDAQIFIRDTVR